jgi:small subunit ribosomal protein S16
LQRQAVDNATEFNLGVIKMSVKIRLARAGTTNRPFYHIVATTSTSPRNGKFLEKLGTYNPLEKKGSENRFKLNVERAKDWLAKGAQPSAVIARNLVKLGLIKEDKKVTALREKAIKRTAEKKAAEAAAKAAESAAAEAPAA